MLGSHTRRTKNLYLQTSSKYSSEIRIGKAYYGVKQVLIMQRVVCDELYDRRRLYNSCENLV